ncbi:MAG: tetratricopeptide repeat protein [Pseudomonadota bacterium]
MSDDDKLNWSEIEQELGDSSPSLDRLRRVVSLFDDFNSPGAERPAGDFTWRHLNVFEQIGSGSFGSVYRAYDRQLRRYVALKLLPSGSTEIRAWLDEARRLARVRHPNVIAIHGAETEGDYGGIWMDLVEGISLDELLNDGPLAEDASHEIASALASALSAVHEAGLVHGDVKGSNVIVEPGGRVILLDFGAAVDHRQGEALSAASPLSAAPETLAGDPAIPESDVYSLGILLYRCLLGRYPFQAETLEDLRQVHHQPPALEDVPRDFRELLRSTLASDPDARPLPDEISTRLQDILKAPERRRQRRSVGLAFAGLAAVVIATAVGWVVSNQARETSELAATRSREAISFLQDVIGASFQGGRGADAKVIDVLEEAERQLAIDTDEFVRSTVEYTLGGAYVRIGRIEEGMSLLETSLARLEDMDSPVASEIGMASTQLGLQLCEDEPGRAKAYAEKALAAAENLPKGHSVHRAGRKVLACVAEIQSDFSEAEKWLREALEIRPPSKTSGHPNDWGTLIHLGDNLQRQGRVGEARDVLERAHEGLVALVGPEHANTEMAAEALASVFIDLSEFSRAAEMLEPLLASAQKRFGTDSDAWISNATTLAVVLSKLGHYERAIALNEQALAGTIKLYAADHPWALVSRINLGVRYKESGQLDRAEVRMADTQEALMQKWGERHRMTLLNGVNLAEVMLMRERPQDAETLSKSVADNASDSLGEQSAITAGARAILARALHERGALDAAEQQFRMAIESARNAGRASLMALETEMFFCELLADRGRNAEALAELDPLRATIEEKLGVDHKLAQQGASLFNRLSR